MNHPNSSSLPPLPPIPTTTNNNNHHHQNQIHTDYSFSPYANWLIPNKILVGESPSLIRSTTSQKIQSIVQEGKCTTFVCLQAERPPQTMDTVDMGGYKDWEQSSKSKIGPSYYYHVRNVGKQMGEQNSVSYVHYGIRDVGNKYGVQFVNDPLPSSSYSTTATTYATWNRDKDHFVNDPLPPSSTTATAIPSPSSSSEAIESTESFRDLIQNLAQRVLTGNETLYIHCGDGIQRTDLVAAGLLGWLYPNLDVEEAIRRVNLYRETRLQQQRRLVCEKKEEDKKQEQRLYVPRGGWIGCVARDRSDGDWWKMVKEEKEEEEERLFAPRGGWVGCVRRDRSDGDWWNMVREEKEKEEDCVVGGLLKLKQKRIVESDDVVVLDQDVYGNEEKPNTVEINEEDGEPIMEHQTSTSYHNHNESIEEHTLEIESNDTISSLSWNCSSSSSEDPQPSPLCDIDEDMNNDENDNDDNGAESSQQPIWNDNPVHEIAAKNNEKLQRPSTASTIESYSSSSTLSSLTSRATTATVGSRNASGVTVVRHSSRVEEIKNRLRSMEQSYRGGRVGVA